VSDGGDGYEAPVEETFTIGRDAAGEPVLHYDGPAGSLPYAVRWHPHGLATAATSTSDPP
jgi:hypothetical protein